MKLPVYLDNHATTKVDPRVVDTMLPYFSENYGNAASKQHEFGWRAEAAVEKARAQVAALIGALPEEIVFVSGATESVNLALKGVAEAYAFKGNHIVTAKTEHRAILDTCSRLEKYGFAVTYVPVDSHGTVSPDEIRKAIGEKTILVSVMLANNEIGTIAPAQEMGAICREAGVVFHTDATQAVGKIPLDVTKMGIDILSCSAHKMYGPKGIGALYIRKYGSHVRVMSQVDGGGHERGIRSGTLNVPAIVGFGRAAEIAMEELASDGKRLAILRDKLVDGITRSTESTSVNGHPILRLPHNANITFSGVRADELMMQMKDIAVSSGSACSSASPEPSHVLRAIGLLDRDVLASLRFGLGRFTTEAEIEYAITRIAETVQVVRKGTQQYQAAQA